MLPVYRRDAAVERHLPAPHHEDHEQADGQDGPDPVVRVVRDERPYGWAGSADHPQTLVVDHPRFPYRRLARRGGRPFWAQMRESRDEPA